MLWWIHFSSKVMKRCENLSRLRLKNIKHFKLSHDCVNRQLWTNALTILQIIFLVPKWSFKILTTTTYGITMAFTISSTLILRLATPVVDFSNVLDVATSIRGPKRSASLALMQPQQNWFGKPLFYHWNWRCNVHKRFTKLFFWLGDFIPQKIIFDPYMKFTFFYLSQNSCCWVSMAVKDKLKESAYLKFHNSQGLGCCWGQI